jgi:hypothetical protein
MEEERSSPTHQAIPLVVGQVGVEPARERLREHIRWPGAGGVEEPAGQGEGCRRKWRCIGGWDGR